MTSSLWIVKNVHTGIVVSEWLNEDDAYRDKVKRDEQWAHVESPDRSPLTVEEVEVAA